MHGELQEADAARRVPRDEPARLHDERARKHRYKIGRRHGRIEMDLRNAAVLVAEPGGAVAFAALLSQRYQPQRGERVGVIISGANTTAVNFER